MSYFITPRVTPLYYHYSNERYICDAFDNSHVQYISDTLHITRSVFNPQFMHFTKYANYAFLLLFSIYPTELELNKANSFDTEPPPPLLNVDLSITNGIVSSKFFEKRDDFNFEIVMISHFLMEIFLAHIAMVYTFYTFV